MKNKVLIIGNGFIGKKLYNHFISNDPSIEIHQLHSLDYFKRIGGINVVNNSIINLKPDYVINAVGYTGTPNVDGCEDNKEDVWFLNVVWPTLLAESCANNGSRLINIGSGCVYNSYEAEYTENMFPNFGVDTPDSSWYSKTKHACELSISEYDNTYNFRIRMPITSSLNDSKNYLTKILKYSKLIDFVNSKTIVDDLLDFTSKFIIADTNDKLPSGNYNVVNPSPLSTSQVTSILDEYGYWNPHWEWITEDELYTTTKCKRSNCVLSTEYTELITGIILPTEEQSIRRLLQNGK